MSDATVTLQEAAKLAKKSVQTIRRAIKTKKVIAQKQRTPQGFNYIIDKESLLNAFILNAAEENNLDSGMEIANVQELAEQRALIESTNNALESVEKQYTELKDLFQSFSTTMQSMIEHSNQERENYMRLMKTFQDRVVMLEDSIRFLKDKRWYQFWK